MLKKVLLKHVHILDHKLLEDFNNAAQSGNVLADFNQPKPILSITLTMANIHSGLINHHEPDRLESAAQWPALADSRQAPHEAPPSSK